MSLISNISGASGLLHAQSATDSNTPSSAEIMQAIKQINGILRQGNQGIYATVERDSTSGLEIVKFIDQNSNETINQFPSKVIVAVAQRLQHEFNSRMRG